MTESSKWLLELKEDPESPEDLLVEFPDDLLAQVGWKPGDVLVWTIEADKIILAKKVD